MLTSPYASVADLKARLQITGDSHDATLLEVLRAASQSISNETGRVFELAGSTAARTFKARTGGWTCRVDDLTVENVDGTEYAPTVEWSTSGNTGTFSAQSGDVILRDVQASGVVDTLEADTVPFPTGRGCWVKVTPSASCQGWGWASVPDPIVDATLLLAARLHKRRATPEGVVGFEGAGVGRIARIDADVAELVRPYCRIEKWVP